MINETYCADLKKIDHIFIVQPNGVMDEIATDQINDSFIDFRVEFIEHESSGDEWS